MPKSQGLAFKQPPRMSITPEHRALWAQLVEDPHTEATILDTISNGGTLSDLAASFGVPLMLVTRWLCADPDRRALYDAACLAQTDAWCGRILDEIQRLALHDVRELFDERGALLDIHEWPAWAAAAVTSLDVHEEVEKGNVDLKEQPDGEPLRVLTGRAVKVKLVNKLDALQLLGKQLGMFKERVELNINVNVADGIKRARARVLDERPRTPSEGGEGGDLGAGPALPPSSAQKIILHPKTVIDLVPQGETP